MIDRPSAPDRLPWEHADPARIFDMLTRLSMIGGHDGTAVSRLAYTQDERDAHELVGGWLRDLGAVVRVDEVGNTIGRLPGGDQHLPAIGIGSHLDSVPDGGRFDGIVGVVGAVELARLIAAEPPSHPVHVVVFAGEEGARFGEPCLGSKAAAGRFADADLTQVTDADGVSLADALRALGFDPDAAPLARWDPEEWAAFLELHIEQARVLEQASTPIGLVDSVSGSTRIRATFDGRADHSGGTPMSMRADALAAASELVVAVEGLANAPRRRGVRITVGRMEVRPNSITTIPGQVQLFVDIRDIDADRQRAVAAEVARIARAAGERRDVTVSLRLVADTSPVVLPTWIRDLAAAACQDLGVESRVMTSGAGHDAQVINAVVPAAMVFVPSRGGLSHVPQEWTSPSEIAVGVDVLGATLRRLDSLLVSLHERVRPVRTGTPG